MSTLHFAGQGDHRVVPPVCGREYEEEKAGPPPGHRGGAGEAKLVGQSWQDVVWLGGRQAGGGQAGAGDQLGAATCHEVLPEDWLDRGEKIGKTFQEATVLWFQASRSADIPLQFLHGIELVYFCKDIPQSS